MAAMLTAAVVTAGVTSLAVLMIMVVTVNIWIIAQISAEQCAHRRISVPTDTAVELDARFGQSRLRTAADASANQSVHAVLHQEACQCAVTAAIGVNDFRMSDFAVHSFIKLELLGVTEVLKNLTDFIGNCNLHNGFSIAIFVGFYCVGSLHSVWFPRTLSVRLVGRFSTPCRVSGLLPLLLFWGGVPRFSSFPTVVGEHPIALAMALFV